MWKYLQNEPCHLHTWPGDHLSRTFSIWHIKGMHLTQTLKNALSTFTATAAAQTESGHLEGRGCCYLGRKTRNSQNTATGTDRCAQRLCNGDFNMLFYWLSVLWTQLLLCSSRKRLVSLPFLDTILNLSSAISIFPLFKTYPEKSAVMLSMDWRVRNNEIMIFEVLRLENVLKI